MIDLIHNKMEDIITACKQHHVESMALFGSAAHNTLHEDSDIDLLVVFSENINILDYADNYFSLLDQLQASLNWKVDLVTVKSLKNPVLKKRFTGQR